MEENNALDLGSLGSFDFTPAWAKKDAGVTVGKVREERPRRAEGERKSFGEKKLFGDRKPFGPKKPFGDRKPRVEERLKPLDAEVKILPETKALGTIIRKLQGDTHAYKLKDLAYFFLDNPQSVLLKITPKDGAAFHQCKACGFASTREEDVVAHALGVHLADYYDTKEVDCEPPKGNFNCVAKCGLSGVLLGPPNIHEFNGVVREMIRTRYPDMSEEQYRAHIEMVRDADTIEEWRKGATKKTVFIPKGGETELSRIEAEGEFKRTILPSLLDAPKHLMITADVAMKSPVKPLVWAIRDAVEAERRAPYNMIFALRGAFHHRKLNFFRVNDARGQEFVTSADLKVFDATHAVPELAAVADYIAEHPCCAKNEVAADPEAEKQLNWLITTGHVVAFTNGVFSSVEKYPKYGPQWRKAKKAEGEEPKIEGEEPKIEEAKVEEVKDESTAQLAE